MNYFDVNYEFSPLDFKIYRPNLLANDGVIDHHQKYYCDYKVTFPKISKLRKISKAINKYNNEMTK